MPKQINTPLPGQSLVRKFSLKGRYQPVLDETIVPVTVVEQIAPQIKRIAQWGFEATAAGAGNSNFFFLNNPSTSGHLMVLTQIWGHSGSPLTDHYSVTIQPEGAANAGPIFRDSRITESPIARTFMNGAAQQLISFPRFEADARVYDVEYVIGPGFALRSVQELANQTFAIGWMWYEVSLAGGEVQF